MSNDVPDWAEIRDLVATLYCASGCSCCRDDDTWYAAAQMLGERLGIPTYDDGSGHDFYSVRNEARERGLELTRKETGNVG